MAKPETSGTSPNTTGRKVDSPGDGKGAAVPNTDPAPATSEEFPARDGVYEFPLTADEQAEDRAPAAGDHRDLSK